MSLFNHVWVVFSVSPLLAVSACVAPEPAAAPFQKSEEVRPQTDNMREKRGKAGKGATELITAQRLSCAARHTTRPDSYNRTRNGSEKYKQGSHRRDRWWKNEEEKGEGSEPPMVTDER